MCEQKRWLSVYDPVKEVKYKEDHWVKDPGEFVHPMSGGNVVALQL